MQKIRSAADNDADAVLHLAQMLSPRFTVEREAFSHSFPLLLNKDDVYLHVAEEAGRVIAYLLGWTRIAFYANGPVGWVQEIVVLPEYRRLGVGSLLMAHFEAWSAERDVRLVSLATRGAAAFYLALGYAESATYYKKVLAAMISRYP